ncbi:MAG: DEAD/DEAH box helicase family protein [Rhizonema sp. NSF051]|nr:DEAD/DEAH box helicase family protein [Rhizonema sp. NSF051]
MQDYLEILRPYQRSLLEKIREQFRQGDRGCILQLATGGGKSKILAAIAPRLRSTRHQKLVTATNPLF